MTKAVMVVLFELIFIGGRVYLMRLSLIVILIGLFGFCRSAQNTIAQSMWDKELEDAISRMHTNGMTKYQSPNDFRPDDFVTRQEAAKFFSEFATTILYKVIDQDKYCTFDDLEDADPSLKNNILNSCLLGIFQWTAGYFRPNDNFTKAQALAVLVRTLDEYKNEETLPWWINYFWKAQEMWLTTEKDPYSLDRPLRRYEMALLIYRAGNPNQQIAENNLENNGVDNAGPQGEEVVMVDELIKTGGGD